MPFAASKPFACVASASAVASFFTAAILWTAFGSVFALLLGYSRIPYAAALDGLLMHLPDRRDLLDGTDIDLYRDVDALLIATPNPLDKKNKP